MFIIIAVEILHLTKIKGPENMEVKVKVKLSP
jgi:hypothetical protein